MPDGFINRITAFFKKSDPAHINSAMGFLLGDMLGSPFEAKSRNEAEKGYLQQVGSYTDDTLMYLAVLKSFGRKIALSKTLVEFYDSKRGFGNRMDAMLSKGECKPTDSWGNGGATRTAALALFKKATLQDAVNFCKVTHTHKDAIKAAKAVFIAVRTALKGSNNLKECWEILGGKKPLETYSMGLHAMESIPPALMVFEKSSSFAEALKNAVSLGGDTDSIAAVTGALAGARYGIPAQFQSYLNKEKRIIEIINKYIE